MISWWERALAAPAPSALPERADAVVVGAGLVGLGAAERLRRLRPHWRVLLLEQTPTLANASTRNAGFACFGTAGELLDELSTQPQAAVRARLEARWRGLLHLRQTLGEAAIGYEPCGGYELFTDAGAHRAALEFLPTLNAWLEVLTGEREVYRPATHGGHPVIANMLEAALDTGRLMAAALAWAAATGVELHLGAEVSGLEPGALVLASGARVAAPHIMLATNAHTARLCPDVAIAPGRGYVCLTEPLPELAWQGTWHYERGYVYFRHVHSPEGLRLLLGGGRHLDFATERSLESIVNTRIRDYLFDFAERVLGVSVRGRVASEWVGVMGFGAEGPVLREQAPGLWVAAGLGGMGVARGLAFGAEAAERIVGATP